MSGGGNQYIVPTKDAKTLPTAEILTGRAFITGKSGSGKSNSGSVIAEQLLQHNFNLLIVDTEGEYFGLKEKFEVLHVGADDFCDVKVTPEHAETIAEIALVKNVPVILDVSGYFDGDEAKELIHDVVAHLFKKEKHERKPFLLIVEELQEYLPQKGGGSDLAKLLERVAKRGRKRGLGICGMSQRPSSVDKDFITQCDWMVWHRLTWKNDVDMVREVLGAERAEAIQEFEAGEAFLMTDWDEAIERVQFRRKTTHDAGATPGLESYERPDLKRVSDELIQEITRTVTEESTDEETTETDGTEDGDDSGEDFDLDAVLNDIEPPGGHEGTTESVDTEDPSQLKAALEKERKRNQLLEDEVVELRSILEGLNEAPANENSSSESSATTQQDTNDTGRTTSLTDPTSASGRADSSPLRKPVPPTPPEPEGDRVGIGGVLAEFGDFSLYVLQTAGYRIRMILYKLRRSSRESKANPNSES